MIAYDFIWHLYWLFKTSFFLVFIFVTIPYLKWFLFQHSPSNPPVMSLSTIPPYNPYFTFFVLELITGYILTSEDLELGIANETDQVTFFFSWFHVISNDRIFSTSNSSPANFMISFFITTVFHCVYISLFITLSSVQVYFKLC